MRRQHGRVVELNGGQVNQYFFQALVQFELGGFLIHTWLQPGEGMLPNFTEPF